MPHIRVTVDGDVLADGDTGTWAAHPPALATEQLKANADRVPGLKAVLFAVAEAAVADRDVTADLTHTDTGWTLTVDEHT